MLMLTQKQLQEWLISNNTCIISKHKLINYYIIFYLYLSVFLTNSHCWFIVNSCLLLSKVTFPFTCFYSKIRSFFLKILTVWAMPGIEACDQFLLTHKGGK